MGWLLTLLLIPTLSYSNINFKKQYILVSGNKLLVEIADTQEKLSQGLMGREKLAADRGMLFIFEGEAVRKFWMKNTLIPLSIGFFDAKKNLIDIQDMSPQQSVIEVPKIYESKFPAKYALEVNKGWFKKNKISLKAKFEFLPASP